MSDFRDAALEQLLWRTTEIQNILCHKFIFKVWGLRFQSHSDGVNKTMENILNKKAFM